MAVLILISPSVESAPTVAKDQNAPRPSIEDHSWEIEERWYAPIN
jgi:hypothetical protein